MTGEPRVAALPGGPLPYTLRHPTRSRGIRVTIDPERGVLVSVPPPTRRGWTRPEPRIEAFLREREAWVRRHLDRQALRQADAVARGPLRSGSMVRFAGELHRLEVIADPGPSRRSVVERRVRLDGPMLIVHQAARDRRGIPAVLRDWCRDQAGEAIRLAVEAHASGLAVHPAAVTLRDPHSRWGSASRTGRLSFSWRLVLAPRDALETVVVHELAHLRVFGHGPRFWAIVAGRVPDHKRWRRWLREHAQELHLALADDDEGDAGSALALVRGAGLVGDDEDLVGAAIAPPQLGTAREGAL